MSTKPDGGPAYPQFYKVGEKECASGGLTMRDYFAAKAMQGFIANPTTSQSGEKSMKLLFETCYEVADAMLAERNK